MNDFRVAKRRPVTIAGDELISTRPLVEDVPTLLLVEPRLPDIDLGSWLRGRQEWVDSNIARHGALLFRGFPIRSAEALAEIVRAVSGEALEYRERSSPRSSVAGRIYTSTDYPPEYDIFPHNEHSYARTFPLKLFFWCDTPAESGGRTPLVDTRRVYARIPADIREEFERKGWMFLRNFNSGLGLPWQTVFQTNDRSAVEAYCREAEISVEWRGADSLRTRQIRRAVARHPRTGDLVWFNHATFFHITTLEPSVRDNLRAEFADDDLPNNTLFGDATPIPDDIVAELRAAYVSDQVSFAWQPRDLVLLDNMLIAHARQRYRGQRRVLFAMSEPTSAAAVEVCQ